MFGWSKKERLKKQYEEEQRRKRNNPSYTCSITDTAFQSWYDAVVEDSSYRSSSSCLLYTSDAADE